MTGASKIRDLVVAAEGQRAYSIDDQGVLTVYAMTSPASPDGAFLFVGGDHLIAVVNTTRISAPNAGGTWEVFEAYEWRAAGAAEKGQKLADVPGVSVIWR